MKAKDTAAMKTTLKKGGGKSKSICFHIYVGVFLKWKHQANKNHLSACIGTIWVWYSHLICLV